MREAARHGVATSYRRDIDGLRAIAVAAVVLFHAGVPHLGGGFVGVDIFYVISGFLIGGIVDREVSEGRFRFANFYLRRARRILPALFAVLAATTIAALWLMMPSEFARYAKSLAAATLGLSNLWFWVSTGYFSPDSRLAPLLMTWSLGIEEQFYVFLPPLLLLLRRWNARFVLPAIALITLASLLLSVVATPGYPVESFYLLPTRAWELGAGVLLGLVQNRRAIRLAPAIANLMAACGILAIGLSLTMFSEATAFPGAYALLPVLGTLALIAARGSTINDSLLGAAPMVGIGLVSYSWYLWHWPLMALARLVSVEPPSLTAMLVIAALSLVLAILSWRFVERPFRSTGARTPLRALAGYGLGLGIAVALCLALIVAKPVEHFASPPIARVEQVLGESHGGPCLANYGEDTPSRSADCVLSGDRGIALLGDSHAAALGSALRDEAAQRRIGFVQMTKVSCPPLLGAGRRMPGHAGEMEACARYNRRASEIVASDPRIDTVVLTAFWDAPFDIRALQMGGTYADLDGTDRPGEAVLYDAIRRTARYFQAHGKRVIILGDVPYLRFAPDRAAFAALRPIRAQLGHMVGDGFDGYAGVVSQRLVSPLRNTGSETVSEAATSLPFVRYASLADTLCDDRSCRYADGTMPWFIDPSHLSRPGARHAIERLDTLF